MKISDVCKFEVKDQIDNMVKKEKLSRLKAQKKMAAWLSEILGRKVSVNTVRSKDRRAKIIREIESTPVDDIEAMFDDDPKVSTITAGCTDTTGKITFEKVDPNESTESGSATFEAAFNAFYKEVSWAKNSGWTVGATKEMARRRIDMLFDIMETHKMGE